MSRRTLYFVSAPVTATATAYVWADSEQDAISKANRYAHVYPCGDLLDLDAVQWGAEGTRVGTLSPHWSINVANDEDRPRPGDSEDCDADA